jgi:ParB-like chromosome segregation protein Spo0J
MMKTKIVKISDVKINPNNPRLIKDDKFAKLVQSIKDLPQMLDIRPIVVNSDMVVLGGNMRLKACKEAGLKQVPIIIADNLTEDQQREFLIKDNVSGGEWDWQIIANDWDPQQLNEWGLNVPTFETQDYSDRNEEIDIDSLDSEMIIKLKYTEEEYNLVREQLSKIALTPEQAVWKLLGNE